METTSDVDAPVRIPAHNTVTKRLGNWTSARRFQVRANRGQAVLDLRSPQIPPGDIHIEVDLDNGVLTLLVADDAVVDGWALHRLGRGRVKDATGSATAGGRRVQLTGQVRSGEIRVKRGGIAVLAAMCSRDYVADLRRAHRAGGVPTVDDPTRST